MKTTSRVAPHRKRVREISSSKNQKKISERKKKKKVRRKETVTSKNLIGEKKSLVRIKILGITEKKEKKKIIDNRERASKKTKTNISVSKVSRPRSTE